MTDERPTTFDHLRSRKKATRRHVDLCLDSEVADAHQEALERVRGAESDTGSRKELTVAKKALDEADVALREASQRFVFQSISRRQYQDLVDEHPPTKDQVAEGEESGNPPDFDVEGFAPALIAACVVDPPMTPDEANELWNSPEWSTAESMLLFITANGANSQSRVVDLGKGSGSTSD